jgi:hypothetical protein
MGAVGSALSVLDSLGVTGSKTNNSTTTAVTEDEKSGQSHVPDDDASRETEVKALEEEIRRRSKAIAWHQGHLGDLGMS